MKVLYIVAYIFLAQVEAFGAEALRILPLGDSITQGFHVRGAYRHPLQQMMAQKGWAYDFVGSQKDKKKFFGGSYDLDHEGHPGWRIDQLSAGVVDWVKIYQPNIVLILAGTNDIYQKYELSQAPQRLKELIVKVRKASPSAVILVGSLFPIETSRLTDPNFNKNAAEDITVFNQNAYKVVAGLKDSKLYWVDHFRGMNALTMTKDGIHPNFEAHFEMARRWMLELEKAI